MSFDFTAFFDTKGIAYITEGENVARGNVNIQCPFCGHSDPSMHMGVNTDTGYWGCWRDSSHRGRSAAGLVKELLGCSWKEAKAIANDSPVMTDELDKRVRTALRKPPKQKVVKVEMPLFFKPANTPYYHGFLRKRGFEKEDAAVVVYDYDLRCAKGGDWAWRLILPVRSLDGQVVGWTARAAGKRKPRYLAHPTGSTIKQHIYNGDQAMEGGDMLVVVEGPLDALKVDFYGKHDGCRAVAMMGTSVTARQVGALARLSQMYNDIVVVLDSGAEAQAMTTSAALSSLGARMAVLPEYVDDPGDLSEKQVHDLISSISR